MDFEEKCLSSEKIYGGKIVSLYRDEVLLPDGSRSAREYIRHSGGAAVLFVKDGKVALVRQYRYAYGEETLEIPAGKLERGELAEPAALRELREETGYEAKNCTHLVDIYPTPGYTDEIIHIYLVTDAVFVGENPDEDEFINCSFLELAQLCRLVDEGKIKDSKTIVACYKYLFDKNKGLN